MGKILVTGATGNIGRYVVNELVQKGESVIAGVINKDQAQDVLNHVCEIQEFDFLNAETFLKALQGVDRIFLMRPPALANPKADMLPFLAAAKKAGVTKICFVSLVGVEKNPMVPHRKIEEMIKELDFNYVFLRPSFFMQNLNTTHVTEIKERHELFIPVGKALTSFIDTRDIALAASIVLCDETRINQTFTLTGSQAISYEEVATILSRVLNRQITYKNPSLLAFRKEQLRRGTKKEFANVMTMLYLMTKLGTAKLVTDELENLIQRKPITFEQYAKDHQQYWQ